MDFRGVYKYVKSERVDDIEEKQLYNTAQSASTLIAGGIISQSAAPNSNSIDISPGEAIFFVHNHAPGIFDSDHYFATPLTWGEKINISLTYLLTHSLTYISIDSTGEIVQSVNPPTISETHTQVLLGKCIHYGGTLHSVDHEHNFFSFGIAQYRDYMETVGVIRLTGNNVRSYGVSPSLQISKSAGNLFYPGVNYEENQDSPNRRFTPLLEPADFFYILSSDTLDGTGTVNTIAPNFYDVLGEKTQVAHNEWTVQRFFLYCNNTLVVTYGTSTHHSYANAVSSINNDSTYSVPTSIARNCAFTGALVVRGDCADLNDSKCAVFFDPFPLESGVSAGQVSISSLQDAYNNSSLGVKIETDATNGEFSLKSGINDNSILIDLQNTGGTSNTQLLANGVINATQVTLNAANQGDILIDLLDSKGNSNIQLMDNGEMNGSSLTLSQQPRYLVRTDFSGSQLLPSGPATTIIFQVVPQSQNVGGFTVENGTNYIVIPETGFYLCHFTFEMQCLTSTTSGTFMTWVEHVGGPDPKRHGCARQIMGVFNPGHHRDLTSTFTANFTAGDKLNPTAYQSTGQTHQVSPNNSCGSRFSLVKLF